MRLLVLLRPNNKQIRLWRKNNGKNPNSRHLPAKAVLRAFEQSR
jgi:hypothetical protein